MDFLKQDDFEQVASSDEMTEIQESNSTALDRAEKSAISYFKNFLRSRYDIDAEFEKQNDDRDETLIIMLCDWVIWTLLANEAQRFVTETRIERKDGVLAWLKGCQKGELDPGFDPLVDDSGNDIGTGLKYGGNEKVNYGW